MNDLQFIYRNNIDPGSDQELKQTFGDTGPWPGQLQDQSFDYREAAPKGVDFIGPEAMGIGGILWPQASKQWKASAIKNFLEVGRLFRDEDFYTPQEVMNYAKGTVAVGKAADMIESRGSKFIKNLFRPIESLEVDPGMPQSTNGSFKRMPYSESGWIITNPLQEDPQKLLKTIFHELTHQQQVLAPGGGYHASNKYLRKIEGALNNNITARNAMFKFLGVPREHYDYLNSPDEVMARGIGHFISDEISPAASPQSEKNVLWSNFVHSRDIPHIEDALNYILGRKQPLYRK